MEVIREEPPPRSRQTALPWEEFIHLLRNNPGEWLRTPFDIATNGTGHARYKLERALGSVEVKGRSLAENPRRSHIYARYTNGAE